MDANLWYSQFALVCIDYVFDLCRFSPNRCNYIWSCTIVINSFFGLIDKGDSNLCKRFEFTYFRYSRASKKEKVRARHVSQGTLDILLERGWIELKGRRKTPGQPLTWGTTDKFLEHFNLTDLKELPTIKEINQLGIEKRRG